MLLFQNTFVVIALLTVITISMIVPILLSRNKMKVSWWDYCFPYLGAPLWFILREFDVGGAISISNLLVEMFCVLLASEAASWIRYGLTFTSSKVFRSISFFLTFLPIIMAVFIRLVMPELPA